MLTRNIKFDMSKLVLNIEQMNHLSSRNIDLSDAQMCYVIERHGDYYKDVYLDLADEYDLTEDEAVPAYTFSDIINKLKKIQVYSESYDQDEPVRLIIETAENDVDMRLVGKWSHNTLLQSHGDNELDTAYNMLIMAIDNNYIK